MHRDFFLLVLLAVTSSAIAQRDFAYERRATRQESRDATLMQYTPPLTLGNWSVVGPFDNVGLDKHDVVYEPELSTTAIDVARTFTGRDGRTVRWEEIADDDWSMLNLKRFGDEADNTDGVAYVFREFTAGRDGEIDFNVGSDDGIKLWVNGALLIDADIYRGFNIQDHLVTLKVREGRNTIFAKITQGTGGWDFQMKPVVDTRILALLNYHLNRDFPESREFEHYQLLSVLEPDDVVLEVGGISLMPDGRPIISTRRGEIFVVDGAYDDPPFDATYTRFASGLHESLGAWWRDDGLYVVQRGELTHLVDLDADDRADLYRTVCNDWGVSGNYHEFAFGPEVDGQGRLWVTLNIGFCGSLGKSIVPWRGWAVIVNDDGTLTPVCGGLRSPNGLGRNAAGEMFVTDNQGDWVGTNKLMHMAPGDWHGHPAANRWYEQAGFTPPRGEEDFKPPAVWFPYDRMGRSPSDILLVDEQADIGPFTGNLLVGDQYAASIMRVSLEEIDGTWQGACFGFLSGFDSGVNRLCWGKDGSLFAGMTNRGWWSHGPRGWGLQRVVFRGETPFEIRDMQAQPDGFTLRFTEPVDPATAGDAASYTMARFTHHRWETYGSPEIERAPLRVTSVEVAEDGMSVRLRVDGMREGFVHELVVDTLRNQDGESLVHNDAYYTLNVMPRGER